MLTRRLLFPVAAIVVVVVAGACSQPAPLSMAVDTPSYRVQLDLDGASLGRRTASIELTDAGRDPAQVDQVVVSTAMPSMDMAGPSVVADEIETGRYEATGDLFTMLGEATLLVRISGDGFEEEATFEVEAKP